MLFTALKKYADFTGTANRQEYWGLFLFIFLGTVITTVLDLMFFATDPGPIYIIFLLGVLIPSFATLARRNRDAGWSQWCFIMAFIPLINLIYYIVIGCIPTATEKEEQNDR